jgi:hypothetical protein
MIQLTATKTSQKKWENKNKSCTRCKEKILAGQQVVVITTRKIFHKKCFEEMLI